ncbi:hypothetical protein H072_6760 [Dactylellina haptotyla CBS 200.50]|uniref:C3H1-type domain-containing protein n=1 Tax=Dactylellina haptotyla (strain CBS 200.50) TaxID=1284197 RepID=S8BVW1_DACHA|nr:hypothetical protein H072_6760 [Dactylellina haptotyla CBS 200.50]
MQHAMFSPNHFNAATQQQQQQPITQQQQQQQQQQLMQQQQLRRTTRSSQRSPQQPSPQVPLQSLPPQHQLQYQGIPQSHLQPNGPRKQQIQLDQMSSYNPNMYVASPDQQMLPGRQAAVNPSYNPSDIPFQFPTFEDIDGSSMMAAATSSHPYQSQMASHSPDHQILQEMQGPVNPQYNHSDIQFEFSQFENPAMIATASPSHPSHPSHAFQGQLTSNSPDPMLGGEAFRYHVIQPTGNADPVNQRALSPLYARHHQQQQQVQQQAQQQNVMNNPSLAPANKQVQQNGALYQDGGNWRVSNGPMYALDQYPQGYLGVPGQFQQQPPATGTPQPHPSTSAPAQAMTINHQLQQQPQHQAGVHQQMISVGPSDDIVETVPARNPSIDGTSDAADAKKPKTAKKKKPQPVAVVPPPPKAVNGAKHMLMDMERLIIFDANLNEDKILDAAGPVTLSYESVAVPTATKSPTNVESPDSPPKKAKSKAAKPKIAKVPQDPVSQMKDRLVKVIEDDQISVTKAVSGCWNEMKAISEEDKDGDEKRIAWLKTIFDNGFDEFFRLMTKIPQIIKRIRKWMVEAWREDKMSAIILHGLQVYQKLALDENDLDEFKLNSVLNTFSKNTRDEKVKQACAHILTRAAKFTAKQEADTKKTDAKTKDSKTAATKNTPESSKVDEKPTDTKPPPGISKSDTSDILKDAAKVASLGTEDSKTAKRKTELLDKDHPNKRIAANPSSEKSKIQLPIAPDGSKAPTAGTAAKPKSSNEGFFANIQKAAKPKPTPAAPQPGGFTSIFDLLKEREAANAAAKSAATTEKPAPVVKKKKSVRWKPDEQLNEIKIFQTELAEGEDGSDPMEVEPGMDAGLVKAKVRANLKEEAQALKNRNFDDYDDEFDMEWDSLTPVKVFWPPDMLRNTCFKRMGDQHSESSEAKKQQERERNVLTVHYSMSHPAPITPFELPSVNVVEQPSGDAWEASVLRPPPGWKRERNYLFGDSYQKKHMARAFMPQQAAPAPAPAPTAPPVSQVDLSSILANLGAVQPTAAPAPQAAPQEPPKSTQIASILAELQKLTPQTAAAPTPQVSQPAPTPTPPQNNPLQSNPLLAFLGIQNPQPAQPQPPAQPQLDLSKALQQLTQQQPPQPQQPVLPAQPAQQAAQPQMNPFAGFPFPFPPMPPQPGQAPVLPFNMPFPPPIPGQNPLQNPLEFMAMYQALMGQGLNPQQQPQQSQQPQPQPQQPQQFGVQDTTNSTNNNSDVKMTDENDNYQPPEQISSDNKNHQDNNNNNSNNGGGNNKDGKGSWSKFGKKKKNFHQNQQPYNKKDKDNHAGNSGGKRVCAFWQAGNCLKKDDCQYSHDGPPGQGGSEQADQIRQHLYGKDEGRSHEKKHKKFKKRIGYTGGSGSAADTAAASASNDWNGEMEY